MTEGFCRVNGLRIHYRRSGCSGPPVVLCHGATDDGSCWFPLMNPWSEAFDLVAPDARGHGRSDPGDGDYGSDVRLADLLGLITTLKLDRPVLVGHSMGAESALRCALEHPDRCRGLVLEDPVLLRPGRPMFGGPWGGFAEGHRRGFQRLLRLYRGLPDGPARLLARISNPRFPRRDIPSWVDSKRLLSEDYRRTIPRIGAADFSDITRLEDLKCRTLLFIGERRRGAILDITDLPEILGSRPEIRVVQVPKADHNIRRCAPAQYRRILDEYLKTFTVS